MSLHVATRAIITLMNARVWPDHAPSMHAMLASDLRNYGFDVEFEFPIALDGDRGGRIDLVCSYGAYAAAIELDCRRPRRKSIQKLLAFPGDRIIGVRAIEGIECPEGITAIVTMRARQARKDELADRRTVNRFEAV